ncbi:EboA domain-containing protein [Phycicoccus flavus]|uniref:Sugar phosphate isomerase n=1 Tax=Phycicoccus flavus TaxID=2502783 RepID=A0A8T6R0P7_9MICO|nr:EboA domain-containing protein [Phycicoccus flavus]NHA67858.1 hypothetical protein [Phycicoccus flavus]
MTWTDDARRSVAADGESVLALFPAAARHARTEGLDGERVRADLLVAIPGPVDEVARLVTLVYQRGDNVEKLAVLRALPDLDHSTGRRPPVGGALVDLLRDALRTNDTRLVGAALGRYGADHLEAPTWRQGVVKALFTGVPLDEVEELSTRSDATLRRMVADLVAERRAAGRDVPDDAWRVVDADAAEATVPGRAS